MSVSALWKHGKRQCFRQRKWKWNYCVRVFAPHPAWARKQLTAIRNRSRRCGDCFNGIIPLASFSIFLSQFSRRGPAWVLFEPLFKGPLHLFSTIGISWIFQATTGLGRSPSGRPQTKSGWGNMGTLWDTMGHFILHHTPLLIWSASSTSSSWNLAHLNGISSRQSKAWTLHRTLHMHAMIGWCWALGTISTLSCVRQLPTGKSWTQALSGVPSDLAPRRTRHVLYVPGYDNYDKLNGYHRPKRWQLYANEGSEHHLCIP